MEKIPVQEYMEFVDFIEAELMLIERFKEHLAEDTENLAFIQSYTEWEDAFTCWKQLSIIQVGEVEEEEDPQETLF